MPRWQDTQQAYLSSILAKYYSTVDVDMEGSNRDEFVPGGDVVAAVVPVEVPRNMNQHWLDLWRRKRKMEEKEKNGMLLEYNGRVSVL